MITGRHAGAAVIIENEMEMKIPTLVCHHHYLALFKSTFLDQQRHLKSATPKELKLGGIKTKKKDSFLSKVRFLFVICDE